MSEMLGDRASEARRNDLRNRLRVFLDTHDVDGQRLMFGSDWIMPGKEPNQEIFLDVIDAFARSAAITGERHRNFFGANTARFLGLTPGSPARQRLEDYYRKNGLDPQCLTRFDAI